MEDKEIICHLYKIRIKSEYYSVEICGNKYAAEKYLKNDLKADEIIWLKTSLLNENQVFKLGKRNKVIARDAFILSMNFICQFGTTRNTKIKNESLGEKV